MAGCRARNYDVLSFLRYLGGRFVNITAEFIFQEDLFQVSSFKFQVKFIKSSKKLLTMNAGCK